jgi:hypothetical protein
MAPRLISDIFAIFATFAIFTTAPISRKTNVAPAHAA